MALLSLLPNSRLLLLLRPELPITLPLRKGALVPFDPAPEKLNGVTDILRDPLCAAFGALPAAELAWLVELVVLEVLTVSVFVLAGDELTSPLTSIGCVVHCCAGLIGCSTEFGCGGSAQSD